MRGHDDIDPFLRDIHQQSEWAAWAAGAARIAAVFLAIERPNQTLSATSGAANGAGSIGALVRRGVASALILHLH
jgi:hypothetical protein